MNECTVFMVPDELMSSAFFTKNIVAFASRNATDYAVVFKYTTDKTGIDAAEEAFDLTNNPYRQEERERVYGRGRSVSIGDVVVTDDFTYVCAPHGWLKIF